MRTRWLSALSVITFVMWALATVFRHVDVSDDQVYRVLARHLAEDQRWLSLRYLPTAYPRFYEHLPFGFWPMAATVRLLGEGALPLTQGLLSLLTVLLAGALGRRLATPEAGVGAMLILATTQNFFFPATLAVLEPELLCFSTAAMLLLLTGPVKPSTLIAAGLLTAAAVGVKGPFGLIAPASAVVARALVDKSPRFLVLGTLTCVLGVAPVVLFVVSDEAWRQHYGVEQFLNSLIGQRHDGDSGFWLPLETVAGRFWPGLAAIPFAVRLAFGADSAERRASRLLGITTAVTLFILCLPSRKVAHHVLVAYPVLAAWSGLGVARWVKMKFAVHAMVAAAVLSAALVAGGISRYFAGPPCVISNELAAPLDALPPGAHLEVIAPGIPWYMLSTIAAERRFVPFHAEQLGTSNSGATWALVQESSWRPLEPWAEVTRARGWVLVRRPDQ